MQVVATYARHTTSQIDGDTRGYERIYNLDWPRLLGPYGLQVDLLTPITLADNNVKYLITNSSVEAGQ